MALNGQRLKNVVDSFSDPNSEALFALLSGQSAKQDEPTIEVQNEITDLITRITFHARYSSTDCLFFKIVQIKFDNHRYLAQNMSALSYVYLIYPTSFRACHPLCNCRDNFPTTFIIKFIYFHDNNNI